MTYKEEGEGIARTVQVHGGVVVKTEGWLVLAVVAVPLKISRGLRQNLKSCEEEKVSENLIKVVSGGRFFQLPAHP